MAAYAAPSTSGFNQSPSSEVEIRVKLANIPNLDATSKTDAICVFYGKDNSGNYVELERTEIVHDNLNPEFATPLVLTYHFERRQALRFGIYDIDNASETVTDDDFVGEFKCSLGDIVGSRGGVMSAPLVNPARSENGTIIVSAEEISSSNFDVRLSFAAQGLDKMDTFSKSDPFLVISRAREDGEWVKVHQTEHIDNTLNPTWAPFTISGRALCNGDIDRMLKFEVFDYDDDGTHDYAGEFTTNVRQMADAGRRDFPVINIEKQKKKKKKYKGSGMAKLVSCEIIKLNSFVEYITGGCEIGLHFAIDFTASNGNPDNASSLHHRSTTDLNCYQAAIETIGNILLPYDSDKQFVCTGFGAKLPDGSVSHCFPLAGPGQFFVPGVAGMHEAYNNSLGFLTLFGPTNFTPTIRMAIENAQHCSQDDQKYTVLCILTDGEISDLTMTVEAIIDASARPLSIIIIGVGDADFSSMDRLDGDDGVLTYGQRRAERDIVQFVPLSTGKDWVDVAAQVLAEVPAQFLSYMKKKNIVPNERPPPPPIAGLPGPYAAAPPPASTPPAPAYVAAPTGTLPGGPGGAPPTTGSYPGGPPAYTG